MRENDLPIGYSDYKSGRNRKTHERCSLDFILAMPLTTKMTRTDFQPAAIRRLERLPRSDIAWVNPAERPAQSTIAAGDSRVDALVAVNQDTDTAISNAGGLEAQQETLLINLRQG